MWLEQLKIQNFKNYQTAEMCFSEQLNGFLGKNGAGKTNLLDAIHYLSLTKSAFQSLDKHNVLHDEQFFTVEGIFREGAETWQVRSVWQKNKKKIFLLNQQPYEALSDHIGRFPVVIIAPDDQILIEGGSEERRKFFDNLFSQIDKQYLLSLIRYNQILKQRNTLLKQFYEKHYFDADLLTVYDAQLLEEGKSICQKRTQYLQTFTPFLVQHYQFLTQKKEIPTLNYQSDFLAENFLEKFKNSRPQDLALQRTIKGIHRDDYEFLLDNHSLRRFGSQGQKKSMLIALKLAKFDSIFAQIHVKPLLLLDDIFDKLDEERMNKLLERVASDMFGQIFITDARPERTQKMIDDLQKEAKLWKIEQGTATKF